MIAGKTHSEILAMKRWKRHLWYKTILPEEKEEAMMIVKIERYIKVSVALTGRVVSEETKDKNRVNATGENSPMKRPEVRDKISGENSHAKRPEVRAKISKASTEHWKDQEFRDKQRASWTPERRAEQGRIMGTKTGEKSYSWLGGKSFEPYGLEFNTRLKSQIRERDNHTCQECQHTEEQLDRALDVHHIDYNKENNSPENLISLCRSCHSQTNFGREDWAEYFREMMEGVGG